MSIKYPSLVTESLAKQISESIRDAIIQGDLQVDEQLPTEEELAVRFNVSRPTIREALKRLAAQNLVRSRRGPTGGTFVNKPSIEEMGSSLTGAAMLMVSMGEFSLAEIAEARRGLELICCRLAAERRNDKNLKKMKQELETQKRADLSDVDFCTSDVAFHRALVDATHNQVIKFVMFATIEALQPATNLVIFKFRKRDLIVQQHEKIYNAIKNRDSDSATKALSEQMDYLLDQYKQAELFWERK